MWHLPKTRRSELKPSSLHVLSSSLVIFPIVTMFGMSLARIKSSMLATAGEDDFLGALGAIDKTERFELDGSNWKFEKQGRRRLSKRIWGF